MIRDHRVEQIMIGSKPIQTNQTYKVAITDFLSSGGDGYTMLKDKKNTPTGLPLRELMVDALRTNLTVPTVSQQRIVRHY